ncbi:MAG TPA: hypothetical protein VF316_22165 [Polyangiaceae bacterium]
MELPPHIEQVLDAARTAPSHDNIQPWLFFVDGETISFAVDPERDRSPGGQTARIGVGAALENALLCASRMGASVRHHEPRAGALVTITVSDPKRENEPDKARLRRTTNRRIYDGRAVDDPTFLWLREATPPLDLTRTHWFGRERVRALAPLLEGGETLYFAEPHLREEALRAIRFDVRDREEVTQGLSIGSLELSTTERMTLSGLRKALEPRMVMAESKKMGARVRRLVESASGLCVITARGSDPMTDATVGRAMQRAWLALTRRGLVAQPLTAMMSLAAMVARPTDSALLDIGRDTLPDTEVGQAAGGPVEVLEAERRRKVAELLPAFRAAFPSIEPDARIAVLLRFGWAQPASARVRRRPLEESVIVGGGEE